MTTPSTDSVRSAIPTVRVDPQAIDAGFTANRPTRESMARLELVAARAEARYLFARIGELEADQLASDEAWIELHVQHTPPRQQMGKN